MNPAMLPLQMQRNAKDTQDLFADLGLALELLDFGCSIYCFVNLQLRKTDEKLKRQSQKGAKVVQQLRNKRQRKKHVVRVDSDGSEIESAGEENEDDEEEERLQLAEEYKNEGNAHFKAGEFEKAIESYTMSLSLDVSNAIFAANRAMAYMKVKKYREAEEDCTRALKHDASYEKALFRRAQCRNELGKLEGAVQDFKAVLRMNPKNGEAKKTLEKINNRLKTKVAWTLERPKNASKIKFEAVEIAEKNSPKLAEEPEANEEVAEKIKEENEEVEKPEAKKDEETNRSKSQESTKEPVDLLDENEAEETGNKQRR
ncbi:Oidioi.mRNA.OKI2018_I69.chr2.g5500.t1.cds [Oikopleura dioica]|uniref:Oidioi.mRNA.OKI2018_I69.chr2.g5500.t1.cds n=1 Tax=Oikopleura dioica TaxID=34765 RepID=A0ABN7T024_OIKDI|nr:Oidioi.mRNA.OKI2018_I69.chr2.g5500.t1.cds [Oikopleura dioica]